MRRAPSCDASTGRDFSYFNSPDFALGRKRSRRPRKPDTMDAGDARLIACLAGIALIALVASHWGWWWNGGFRRSFFTYNARFAKRFVSICLVVLLSSIAVHVIATVALSLMAQQAPIDKVHER